jgi:hypothetical protein
MNEPILSVGWNVIVRAIGATCKKYTYENHILIHVIFKSSIGTICGKIKNQKTQLKPWYDIDLNHRLAECGWVSTSKDLVMLRQWFMNNDFISGQT